MATQNGATTKQLLDAALKLANLKDLSPDSGIMQEGTNIKKALFGIDMGTAELLLAKELGFDLVVSHHPEISNPDMLNILEDTAIEKLESLGVPKNHGQKLIAKRRETLSYWMQARNADRSESAARLMKMPFMSVHTPADIITENFLQNIIDKKLKKDAKLKDVLALLNEVPEYKHSNRKPIIRIGNDDSFAGKVYVDMAGFMDPGPKVYEEFFKAGVGTLILMHIDEKDVETLRKLEIGNIIVYPHMASDSIGVNIIIKEWEKLGVQTTIMSGMVK
jgi:putative NIF3 family GTP cyclohydrolase 1 type 2